MWHPALHPCARLLSLCEQTPQEADRRVSGLAPGVERSLYYDAMTDPEDKPSFLARVVGPLAIVVTFAVPAWQFLVVALPTSLNTFNFVKQLAGFGEAHFYPWPTLTNLVIFPALAYLVVAVLYHWFKGKSSPGGNVLTLLLYSVWIVSLIVPFYFWVKIRDGLPRH